MKSYVSILAFTSISAFTASTLAAGQSSRVLGPILNPTVDLNNLANIAPSKAVSLHYGSNSTANTATPVVVALAMKYPTVLLEQIASVSAVDCTSSSVLVTFSNEDAFSATVDKWSSNGDFVIVTNHLGNCDAESERALFLVESVIWNTRQLTVMASSSRQNISTTAATGEFSFGVQSSNPLSERALVLDPSFTISSDNAVVAPDTIIYTDAPYVTITANEAYLDVSVTFSGYLQYDFIGFKLVDLYFDIDAALDVELAITAALAASYDTSYAYTPDTLTYSLLDVPGIISLGPALAFSVGVGLNASAAADITAALGVTLSDGNVHIDALDSTNSSSSGWTPKYTASANLTGELQATISPYVSLEVELAVNILDGLLDMSTGISAKPDLDFQFILTANEGVSLAGVTGVTSDGTCEDGLELKGDFAFSLNAFVTQFYSTVLYSYNTQLYDKCYSWIS